MGVSQSRSFSLDSFVTEIGNDVSYDKSLGNSRFLKAIRGKSRSGRIVVKVFTKADPSVNLQPFIQRLKKEKSQLVGITNVYTFQTFLETDKAAYKIRQYIGTNLYDRVSTRPFWTPIEKKWVAFQLLVALQDSHTCQVAHGDIKSENVLVTSSNWVYLTDFASIKPSHLPLDDPTDFSLYFDTSARRTCYLAPERFFDSDSEIAHLRQLILEKGASNVDTQDKLVVTEAMDVFSAGCVIAELFLEGTPLFTLSQLLRYKEGNYDPTSVIEKIDDDAVRELVVSMIQIDPENRQSFSGYLVDFRQKLFPDVFYAFLHDYCAKLLEPIQQPANPTVVAPSNTSAALFDTTQPSATTTIPNHVKHVPEERIEKMWTDWLEISSNFDERYLQVKEDIDNDDHADSAIFPVQLSIPNVKPLYVVRKADVHSNSDEDDTALLISTLLCSNIRDCLTPTSKIKALELLLTVSCYLKDETKLDRIIPYIVDLLSDTNANVRAATLRTITQILLIVGGITPANSTVFIEYLLPLIIPLATDESELVRSMFAQCISPIAETGQKFLDLAESMKSNNTYTANEGVEKMLLAGNESFENSYEASSQDLQIFIQDVVATLLTDKSSMVKRSLLQDIIPLCLFFGPAKSNDLLLTHINTYLNDKDWELRSAFFDSVVGIATCVGGKCVEEYILPLVIQALADPEENVIVNVLNSIRKLAELGLFKKVHIWELIGMTFALLVHPNVCIRQNVIEFISAAVSRLPETDTWCIIYPQLTALISGHISRVDVDSLSEAVLPPLPRKLFVIAQEWSLKVPKSPFWKTGFGTSPIGVKEGLRSLRASIYQSGSQASPKVDTHICDEDKPFIDRMTLNGFTKEDEVKLRYLRSHIMMLAKAQESKLSEAQKVPQPDINNVIALSDLKVAPQTVFIGLRNSNLVSGTLEANFKSRSNLSKQRSIESWSRQISTLSQRSTPVNEYARPPVQIPSRGDVMDLRKRLAQPPASVQAIAEPTKAMDVSRRESTTTLETIHSTSPKMADFPGFDGASPPDSGSHAGSPLISYIRPPRRGPLPSDGQKAAPAIGAISTNALGMLEVPRRDKLDDGGMNSGGATPISAGGIISKTKLTSNQTQYHHTYEGKDPAILMMLDKVCKESLKEPLSDFGNKVIPPLLKRKKSAVLNDDDGFSMRMVGQFKEHTSAITSIVVSPDHLFFVTGSSDHTVKVWDTTRLEKNVTSKSRHTLKRGEAVKALCVIQDTHCIAVACKDGTIAIFRVDLSVGTNLPKYASELCIVREFNVKFACDGEYVTWMFHYSNDLSSSLVYTTSFSRLCIVDLRNNQDILELEAPVSHGPVLSACIDSTRSWIVTGSLFGHLCLWDIRFGMMVHTWMSRREGSINQIEIEPSSEELILVSLTDTKMSNTVIEVHNVATKQVVDVYESQPLGESKGERERQDGSTVKAIDDIIKVGKETHSTVPLESESARSFLIGPASKKSGGMWYSYAAAQAHAAAQLNTSAWVLEDSKNKNARKERKKFLIIGTNSQQIKCWNLDSDWHKSKILSGGHKEVQYVMRADDDGRELHCEERVTQENKRTNRSLQVNEQNDRLLSSHNQSVEALAAIEVPFRALISGDRGGIFKLWRVD